MNIDSLILVYKSYTGLVPTEKHINQLSEFISNDKFDLDLFKKEVNQLLKPNKVRWTHPYGFRSGEWSTVLNLEEYIPENLIPRLVYKVQYDDGIIDYIPVSEKANLEFQY